MLFTVPGVAGNLPEFSEEWILVRLSAPIQDRHADGSFSLETGLPAVDEAIQAEGIVRIDAALRFSYEETTHPGRFAAFGFDRTYRFHVKAGADIISVAERFAGVSGVDFAEPDWVGQGGATVPNDPRFIDQWGLQQTSDHDVDAPEGWDVSTGDDLVLAVLDSGADSDHEDLAAKLVAGRDFVNEDNDPEDDHGHGTNVVSISGAVTDNSLGIAGTCWDCRIMPLKVLDQNNSGLYSWWADAMVWATDHGARVINLSAGGLSDSIVLHDGVRYAWEAGVVHVSITHNDNFGVIRYPGRYPETLTVGATDPQDQRAVPFCYSATSGSNWGPEIDVSAPGELILGAAMGGGYNRWCGTSQAAPLVAGLVGVLESLDPSFGREEIRHLVRSGAEDQVGRLTEDTAGFDNHHGWGRVNMDRTLRAARATRTLRVEGKSATRVRYDTPNPLAVSYDFIRGALSSFAESSAGVDLGEVVCLEDDSPDPDTLGNEDSVVPDPGSGFFYLGRFRAAPGEGEYGGSSRNRDRIPATGDCLP